MLALQVRETDSADDGQWEVKDADAILHDLADRRGRRVNKGNNLYIFHHFPRNTTFYYSLWLKLCQFAFNKLSLVTGYRCLKMFSQHDVDSCLHWVLRESVDKKSLHYLCLMVKLADKSFFAISTHSADCWICSCILPRKVVTLLGPHGSKLLDHWVTISLVHKRQSVSRHLRPKDRVEIETKSP